MKRALLWMKFFFIWILIQRDQEAMNYYYYVKQLNKEAVCAYEQAYGPLMIDQVSSDNWSWIKSPWAVGRRECLMWRYEKRLQYPVNISQTNPKMAQFIISQYGGPDGEAAGSSSIFEPEICNAL